MNNKTEILNAVLKPWRLSRQILLKSVFVLALLIFYLPANASEIVSIDVKDADLRQTLEKIARQASINIIVSPKVTGKITCLVKNMDAKELILFIARTNGLEVEDHGRILAILAGKSTPTNVRFEVIPLQNANSAEVAKIIQTLQRDKNVTVTHDERTNRLIVVYGE